MPIAIYVLCTVTSLACAVLLFRAYARGRVALLLWSGLCFVGLALNNALLLVDLVLLTSVDLAFWRKLPALLGVGALLYGVIWKAD